MKSRKTPEGRHASSGWCICISLYIIKVSAKKYREWGSNP